MSQKFTLNIFYLFQKSQKTKTTFKGSETIPTNHEKSSEKISAHYLITDV